MDPSASADPVCIGKSSQYRGVSWTKRDARWVSQIRAHALKKNILLGAFTAEAGEKAAAEAYDAAAFFIYGSSAKLNFPQDYFNLKPGQVPPSLEEKVTSNMGRKYLEEFSLAKAGHSNKTQFQKRKRGEENATPGRTESKAGATPSLEGSIAPWRCAPPEAPTLLAGGQDSTGFQLNNSAGQQTSDNTGSSSFDEMVSAYNLKQAKSAALASVKKEQETLHTRLIEVEAKINAAKAEYVRLLQQQLDSLSSRS